jgi:hypothetical protein
MLALRAACRLLGHWLRLDERRQRRAIRHDLDRRLAAWRSLPADEQVRWVYPASPQKPPDWSLAGYRTRGRR